MVALMDSDMVLADERNYCFVNNECTQPCPMGAHRRTSAAIVGQILVVSGIVRVRAQLQTPHHNQEVVCGSCQTQAALQNRAKSTKLSTYETGNKFCKAPSRNNVDNKKAERRRVAKNGITKTTIATE